MNLEALVQFAVDNGALDDENLRETIEAFYTHPQPKQEPVLVVEKEPDYMSGGHFHTGTKPHIDPTKVWSLPIGTKLYTHPQPKQEPVAYLLRRQDRSGYETGEKTDYGAFPVYTHPQPKREPMTDEQIHIRYKAMRGDKPPRYIEIYRDCENAHGIKENT